MLRFQLIRNANYTSCHCGGSAVNLACKFNFWGGTMNVNSIRRLPHAALVIASAILAPYASAAPLEPVMSLSTKEKAPLLDTLKDLVSIESGSGDREGLDKISELIANRLRG